MLRQVLALVCELRQARVQCLDVEQSDLVGGRGFQLGAPEVSSLESLLSVPEFGPDGADGEE